MREERWAKMTDYERAIAYLQAHAGYSETKERLLRMLRDAPVKEPEEILNRLISENKITFDPEAKFFPYTLHFIAVKDEEDADDEDN